jgi:hypothetical protein
MQTTMDHIPDHLVSTIISKLPRNEQVTTARRVCRSWKTCVAGATDTTVVIRQHDEISSAVLQEACATVSNDHHRSLLCSSAASQGLLTTLQWLLKNGCKWNAHTYIAAARHGHLHVLKYMRSSEIPCPSSYKAYVAAAEGGHTNVMQLLHAQFQPGNYVNTLAAYAAAKHGRLNVIKWMKNKNAFSDVSMYNDIASTAAYYGHISILRWFLLHEQPSAVLNNVTSNASARGGSVRAIQWLYEHECPMSAISCANGVCEGTGSMPMISWILNNLPIQHTWNTDMLIVAAGNGHVDIVEWLHYTMFVPWDIRAPTLAAKNGQITMLRWLAMQQPPCPINMRACRQQAEISRWLKPNCPEIAAVIEWLNTQQQ